MKIIQGKPLLGNLDPLGKVLVGHGNNGQDGSEGARYQNVFCSYLHGPLLPKNSKFTDMLIQLAIERRGIKTDFIPLENGFEVAALKVTIILTL